ncbi:MAG: hypothetical protein JSW09_04305 [Pseudomonadota bacterium]|nr:MAG: hypothetical protein JSW09_04305 [Pseudomonadota bacterium]
MPFIHIKSLPFREQRDIPAILEGLCKDFARDTGVALRHITTTWEHFAPGHYAVAGKTVDAQPINSHPVLVDLHAPDSNSAAIVERMLESVASSLASRARIPRENVFVSFRPALSGGVFAEGGPVRW